jgi:hypothetical protein
MSPPSQRPFAAILAFALTLVICVPAIATSGTVQVEASRPVVLASPSPLVLM